MIGPVAAKQKGTHRRPGGEAESKQLRETPGIDTTWTKQGRRTSTGQGMHLGWTREEATARIDAHSIERAAIGAHRTAATGISA